MSRRRAHEPISHVERWGSIRADYEAAKASRFQRVRKGLSAVGSGADFHYRTERDWLKLVEYARDIDRNDKVVGQAVSRLADNVIQQGFRLKPDTGDQDVDAQILELWDNWSMDPDRCHSAQEKTFSQLERLAFRHSIVDGDVFALPLDDGSLQILEAHRVRTPSRTKRNVIHGVLMDEQRRRLSYWVTKEDVNPLRALSRVGDVTQIPARDADGNRQVFHVFDPDRISQTRGITPFVRVMDTIGMHDDLQLAKLIQAQTVSCFGIIRELADDALGVDRQTGERTEEAITSGGTRITDEIGPGMEFTGEPGEKISGFSPGVPNAEHFKHTIQILTFISINLHLPVAVLLLDPSQTNFSGWRGAIDQARMSWKRLQSNFAASFHRHVYRWKLRNWIATNPDLARAAADPSLSIFRHAWHCPRWPYLEPTKDAAADLLRMRNGLAPPRVIVAERGFDWGEMTTHIVEDNATAIRKARAMARLLNAEAADGERAIDWREVYSLPTPDGVSVSISPGGDSMTNEPIEQEAANV